MPNDNLTAPAMEAEEPKRDPRIDPRPRDVIEKGSKQRQVTERNGNEITYQNKWGLSGARRGSCWITTWRDWAKDSEVIHVSN